MSRKAKSKKAHKVLVRRKVRKAENLIRAGAPSREKTLGGACRRLYGGGLAIL